MSCFLLSCRRLAGKSSRTVCHRSSLRFLSLFSRLLPSPAPVVMSSSGEMSAAVNMASAWGSPCTTTRYDAESSLLTAVHARHAFTLAALPRGARILDVAAGTGALTFHALPFVSHVTATDFRSDSCLPSSHPQSHCQSRRVSPLCRLSLASTSAVQ
jgi:hypothetical protein